MDTLHCSREKSLMTNIPYYFLMKLCSHFPAQFTEARVMKIDSWQVLQWEGENYFLHCHHWRNMSSLCTTAPNAVLDVQLSLWKAWIHFSWNPCLHKSRQYLWVIFQTMQGLHCRGWPLINDHAANLCDLPMLGWEPCFTAGSIAHRPTWSQQERLHRLVLSHPKKSGNLISSR